VKAKAEDEVCGCRRQMARILQSAVPRPCSCPARFNAPLLVPGHFRSRHPRAHRTTAGRTGTGLHPRAARPPRVFASRHGDARANAGAARTRERAQGLARRGGARGWRGGDLGAESPAGAAAMALASPARWHATATSASRKGRRMLACSVATA